MVELNGVRIWARVMAGGRLAEPRKLVCGTLAEPLSDAVRLPFDGPLGARLDVPGRPELTIAWTGWFFLVATGEVAAVYGAVVEPVG